MLLRLAGSASLEAAPCGGHLGVRSMPPAVGMGGQRRHSRLASAAAAGLDPGGISHRHRAAADRLELHSPRRRTRECLTSSPVERVVGATVTS